MPDDVQTVVTTNLLDEDDASLLSHIASGQ
jgi:hypothetical protein